MRKLVRPYTDPTYLFRHGGVAASQRDKVLDFSASINPLGPPASVLRVLRDELPAIARYPDPECRALRQKLAEHHGVTPEQIAVGNGSNELIYAIARALKPRRVAIAEPTYTEYLRASLTVEAKVDHWLAEGDRFKLKPFDPEGADIVWICNPNNPTGGLWAGADHLTRWMDANPRTTFVVDEAFLSLGVEGLPVARGLPRSLIWKLSRLKNLIVLRSFTKRYALPGLRLGYALAQPEIGRRLRAQIPPWSVNALAQRAGLVALEDQDYRRQTGEWLMSAFMSGNQRADMRGASSKLCPLTSATIFHLVRLKNVKSDWLTARLAEHGVVIRDASNFVGLDQSYVRIARRTAPENARLVEALQAVLPEAKPCPAL
jgi:threonine-phosphate decarboxylase